jgi:hypothetical protein
MAKKGVDTSAPYECASPCCTLQRTGPDGTEQLVKKRSPERCRMLLVADIPNPQSSRDVSFHGILYAGNASINACLRPHDSVRWETEDCPHGPAVDLQPKRFADQLALVRGGTSQIHMMQQFATRLSPVNGYVHLTPSGFSMPLHSSSSDLL